MKSIVKTRKILKVIWPGCSTANTMCRILDKLEEIDKDFDGELV